MGAAPSREEAEHQALESPTKSSNETLIPIEHPKLEAKEAKAAPKIVLNNLEAITKEADDVDDLYQRLRSGISLSNKKKKYWVDESGFNCFTVFAREFKITWSDDPRYWNWRPLNDYSSDAGIEVACLQNVCWLEVLGKLDASYLSAGVTYEVTLLVMMKDPSYGWHVPVNLRLVCPGGVSQDHKVSLNDSNLRNRWVELPVGTFSTGNGLKGEIEFSMFEYRGGIWKRGLVIRGAVIRPVRLVVVDVHAQVFVREITSV